MLQTPQEHNAKREEKKDHPQLPRRFWRGAHRDWRVWSAVVVIFIAMMVFIMSDNFGWQSHGETFQPQAGHAQK